MSTAIALLGIVFAAFNIIVSIIRNANSKFMPNYDKRSYLIVTAAAIMLILFGNSFTIVPTGSTGVLSNFGQIREQPLPNGFNWKVPFVSQVRIVNNKQQSKTFDGEIWGETNDKTPVYASDVTVTYQINPDKSAWIYKNVTDLDTNLIPFVMVGSSVKDAMVKFAYNEVTVRSNIEPESLRQINNRLAEKYGEGTVTVMQVVIGQMDFEEAYNQAIQQKSIAAQQKETQKIENDTAVEKAEANKKVAILNAEAEAEKVRIAAEAEAEANQLLNESLTDNILRSNFYDKWNGVLPKVMGESTVITDIADNN